MDCRRHGRFVRAAAGDDDSVRISGVGIAGAAGPEAQGTPRVCVGLAHDAGALAVVVRRGLARTLSARARSLSLGEDRAWSGEDITRRGKDRLSPPPKPRRANT